MIACPLTFNTANKLIAGIMDIEATGVLCDAVGAGMPVVAVPMVNDRLWSHPAWGRTLRALADTGVTVINPLDGSTLPRAVASGTGPEIVEAFRPGWVVDALGPA